MSRTASTAALTALLLLAAAPASAQDACGAEYLNPEPGVGYVGVDGTPFLKAADLIGGEFADRAFAMADAAGDGEGYLVAVDALKHLEVTYPEQGADEVLRHVSIVMRSEWKDRAARRADVRAHIGDANELRAELKGKVRSLQGLLDHLLEVRAPRESISQVKDYIVKLRAMRVEVTQRRSELRHEARDLRVELNTVRAGSRVIATLSCLAE